MNISSFNYRLTMASSEIYFKEVVVVTTIPTNKVNLGEVILKDIEKKTFPRDTTFYVICGFHTKENGEPAKYDSNLMKQFQEMSNNLAKKIKLYASDMGYSLAPNIVLETQETGM